MSRGLYPDAATRADGTAGDDSGESSEIGVGAVDPLDGHAEGCPLQPSVIDLDRLEIAQDWRSVIPARVVTEREDIVTPECGDRDATDVLQADLRGEGAVLVRDGRERRAGIVDEIHLVDGEHDVTDPEQRHQVAVPSCLRHDALAGVDEKDSGVGGGGARDHVASVLLVTGRIGDDELALVRGEEAVGDVDRDPLLPFGDQPVQEEREVQVAALRAHLPGVGLEGCQLILEQHVGFIEQPADQRALPVVDAATGDEPQQALALLSLQVVLDGHQK
jgi:hypothetical protein